MGLSLLSTLSPDAFRLALANQEPALLARTPGVGKRTAEKIVLELKDKVRAGFRPQAGSRPLHLVLQFQHDLLCRALADARRARAPAPGWPAPGARRGWRAVWLNLRPGSP